MLSNITLILIPFFLGAVIDEVDKQEIKPKYTFHVRVDTLYIEPGPVDVQSPFFDPLHPGKYDLESNAGLSFEVVCRPQTTKADNDKLRCHIRKRHISRAPSTDPEHMVVNHNFVSSPFVYSQISFVITFGNNGTVNYNIPKNITEESGTLSNILANFFRILELEMFRTFGDQLSVTDITSRGNGFKETENSYVGTCPTFYRFSREPISNSSSNSTSSYKLRTLINDTNFRLNQNETLYISKQRLVHECTSLTNYILGKTLWRDLLPEDLTAKTTISTSVMKLSERDVEIKSVNLFDLFSAQDEQQNQTVAFVQETIRVRLKTVEV